MLCWLGGYGLELVEQASLFTEPNTNNLTYLRTKRAKLGHLLDGAGLGLEAPEEEAAKKGPGRSQPAPKARE